MKHPFSFFAQFFGVKVKLSDKRLRKKHRLRAQLVNV